MTVKRQRRLAGGYLLDPASSVRVSGEPVSASLGRRQWLLDMAVILPVAAAGLALALQGWRERIPAFDMLTYFNSAHDLLTKGTLARYGDISSYASFSPPGTTWLMAPGMLMISDPRLYEKLGAAALHFGTLLGLFFLARTYFGNKCAYLAVLLYGLSTLGLSFAGSLWPIGHPFFYVWMVYMADRWVTRQNTTYLAAAIGIWAAGMFVDMAIAPALFVLPAIWLLYRPRLRAGALVVVAALAVALWYPYLQFESTRGFVDLKSQFLRQNILPADYRNSWCDPSLTLQSWEDPSSVPRVELPPTKPPENRVEVLSRALLTRMQVAVDGLLSNFETGLPIPGAGILLLLLVLGYLVAIGKPDSSTRALDGTSKTQVLAICLLVPWLILLLVAEPGRSERFLWLWPLQVIVIAAAATHILSRLKLSPVAVLAVQILLVLVLISLSVLPKADSWIRNGWSGQDAMEVQVADYVAEQIRATGGDSAAVGYHVFIYPWMALYNIINRDYKVGVEFDLWLKFRHGVVNTDSCAEGVSPTDEYRVVQVIPENDAEAPREYFDTHLDKSFTLLRDFGAYQVFKVK
jgi:hypothetical protein